jgi:hypothetical protein
MDFGHAQPCPSSERRRGPDRRHTEPLLADWRFAFRGRRRGSRRDGDDGYSDVYDPRLLLTTVAVLILSTLDAAITLTLLDTGLIREANPFMRVLIEHDVQVFINLKTALTAAGLLLLVAASHTRVFGRIRVRSVLHCVLGLYMALIGYELTLLRMVSTAY